MIKSPCDNKGLVIATNALTLRSHNDIANSINNVSNVSALLTQNVETIQKSIAYTAPLGSTDPNQNSHDIVELTHINERKTLSPSLCFDIEWLVENNEEEGTISFIAKGNLLTKEYNALAFHFLNKIYCACLSSFAIACKPTANRCVSTLSIPLMNIHTTFVQIISELQNIFKKPSTSCEEKKFVSALSTAFINVLTESRLDTSSAHDISKSVEEVRDILSFHSESSASADITLQRKISGEIDFVEGLNIKDIINLMRVLNASPINKFSVQRCDVNPNVFFTVVKAFKEINALFNEEITEKRVREFVVPKGIDSFSRLSEEPDSGAILKFKFPEKLLQLNSVMSAFTIAASRPTVTTAETVVYAIMAKRLRDITIDKYELLTSDKNCGSDMNNDIAQRLANNNRRMMSDALNIMSRNSDILYIGHLLNNLSSYSPDLRQ